MLADPEKEVNMNTAENRNLNDSIEPQVDTRALFSLSYGVFVLLARDGENDNGCIINTVTQVTDTPLRLAVTVNKRNLTHDMIAATGVFNLSVLDESAPFRVFEHFGFHSGRDTDKFADCREAKRSANGLYYLPHHANAFMSCRVIQTVDCGTHSLFIAELTQAEVLSDLPSMTYRYYRENVKPKPPVEENKKKGFVCTVCGYVYEGDTLPPDFICPLCGHGASDFVPLS